MLRLILLLIGLLLVWVLFFSKFKKKTKIAITLAAIACIILGIWLELKNDILSEDLISLEQINVCELKVEHSYRTNYKTDVCLTNQASNAIAKRITLRYVAMYCSSVCEEIDTTIKERLIHLPPQQTITLTDNVRFDQINVEPQLLQWQVDVITVKSTMTQK